MTLTISADRAKSATEPRQRTPGPHDLPGAKHDKTKPNTITPRASFGGGQAGHENQKSNAPAYYAQLRAAAELFNDVQEFRKSTANKLRLDALDTTQMEGFVAALDTAEKNAKRALLLAYREVVPAAIREWQQAQPGIGAHLLGRLLGRIGDPRIAIPLRWEGKGKGNRILVQDGEPYERTVSQLWSYCGHGDPGRKMHKGITAEELMALGDPRIKALVWNISCACLKTGVRNGEAITPYGALYMTRRNATAERVHTTECVRCGPAGKPAQPGSPWSKAHQHNDALRIVGKEVLRDLWIVAGGHWTHEPHPPYAPVDIRDISNRGFRVG